MENKEALSTMKGFSRQTIRHIWEQATAGEILSDPEEASLARMMKEHPQYNDYWARADEVSDEEIEESNPFLHLTLEAVVENQLQSGEIPEVKESLEHLIKKGFEPHQARHRVS